MQKEFFPVQTSPFFNLFFLLILVQPALAQPTKLSLKDLLQKVQANLPILEAYRQQAIAARQNIQLTKNNVVPELTAGYQINMATFNNITGMSYPGFLLPVSGPPSQNNDLNFVPGSALGALVKWNPFSFGQRNASIEKATAQFKQANAVYNEQLFQYQYSAVNIYLEAVYFQRVTNSMQAGIDRNRVGLEQSLILAVNGLKAGIDTAQFQSAIAQAEIDLLQTEQTYGQKLTELTRLIGDVNPGDELSLSDTAFTQAIVLSTDTTFLARQHPYYLTLEAQKNTAAAELKEIQKSWVPQLDIWGNLYARGSGINELGQINKSDGFNLSRTNLGAGLQLAFPVLQFTRVNIKKKQYLSLLKANEAKLAQAQLDIGKQIETAMIQYRENVKIAGKTPILLKSANDVYEGLKLSYETGLIDYTRLSQAQYELLKAEVSDANARLQVWRSLLAVAVAKGNLGLFIDQLR
ncbi:MAG: TolC family protein [Chitinophagaceae bacterium]